MNTDNEMKRNLPLSQYCFCDIYFGRISLRAKLQDFRVRRSNEIRHHSGLDSEGHARAAHRGRTDKNLGCRLRRLTVPSLPRIQFGPYVVFGPRHSLNQPTRYAPRPRLNAAARIYLAPSLRLVAAGPSPYTVSRKLGRQRMNYRENSAIST